MENKHFDMMTLQAKGWGLLASLRRQMLAEPQNAANLLDFFSDVEKDVEKLAQQTQPQHDRRSAVIAAKLQKQRLQSAKQKRKRQKKAQSARMVKILAAKMNKQPIVLFENERELADSARKAPDSKKEEGILKGILKPAKPIKKERSKKSKK